MFKIMESALYTTAKGLDMVAHATMAIVGKDQLGATLIEVPPIERTMAQINCDLIVAHRRTTALHEEKITLLREKQVLARKEIAALQAKREALLAQLEGPNK